MKLAWFHFIAFVILAHTLAWAQQPSHDTSSVLTYENGSITNNVYTNKCFGFSLVIPDGWQSRERLVVAEAKAVHAREGELILLHLIQPTHGSSRNETTLRARHANGSAPTVQEFVSDAVHGNIEVNRKDRELVRETYSVDYGGKIFFRADYNQKLSVSTPYKSLVFTKFRGLYIGEVLSAESSGELELAASSLHGISFGEDEPNSKCVMSGDDNRNFGETVDDNSPNSGAVIGGVLGSKRSTSQSNSDLPQRVRVSQGVSTGLLITRVQPRYPDDARQARIQGTVVLKALIDANGDVEDLTLVSGHPMLAPAALEAVKQWKYKPYLLNGRPVKVETQITVNFQLWPY
jgi:TonB family protein